jgi:WD40 repeat protein/uncharacterized caspase-like protein
MHITTNKVKLQQTVLIATALVLAYFSPAYAQTAARPVELISSISGEPYLPTTFSANGKYMAASSNDVQLWDVEAGRLVRKFRGLDDTLWGVSLSQDAQFISAISWPKLMIWNSESGKIVDSYSPPNDFNFYSHTFVAGGTRIFFCGFLRSGPGSMLVGLYDFALHKVLWTRKYKYNQTLVTSTVSRDGRLIAAGDNEGSFTVYSIDGNIVREFSNKSSLGNDGFPTATLAFSPDSRVIASGNLDGSVKLWDISTGAVIANLRYFPAGKPAPNISWSSGSLLAAGSSKEIVVWDTKSLQIVSHILPSAIGRSDFSNNPLRFLPGTDQLEVGNKILDARSAHVVASLGISPQVKPIIGTETSSPKMFFSSSKDIYNLDLNSLQLRHVFQAPLTTKWSSSVSASAAAEQYVATEMDQLFFLNRQEGGYQSRLIASGLATNYGTAISPDGKLVVATSGTKAIVFNGATRQELGEYPRPEKFPQYIFSPDSSLLADRIFAPFSLHQQPGLIEIRDPLSWKRVTTIALPGNYLFSPLAPSFAFSPDGKSLVAVDDGLPVADVHKGLAARGPVLELWSIKGESSKPEMINRFQISGPDSIINSVSFHPDGTRAITNSSHNELCLWNLRSGTSERCFKGRDAQATSAAFYDGGKRLVSYGTDGFAVWDTDSGQLLISYLFVSETEWLAITPEGFFDASSAQAARYLSIVRGLEVSSIDQVYDALYRPDLIREKLAGDPNSKVKAAAAQLDLDKVMASGAAPKVTITSPATGSTAPTDEISVEASVADQDGGIGKVEWRVNGITLGLEGRGLDRLDASSGSSTASGRTETVKRTLSLEPGDNRIEVVAYNAKGLIVSEPAEVTIKWDGAKTASPPKLYVLAVGVNDYSDSRLHLAYAVPDATALADAFKKSGTGLYASVEVKTVLDSDVTLSNLDKVFADLSQKVQPRDVFVFFLAGHGKTENGRYYFLPRDFRYEDETSIQKAGMGQDKFQAWFAEIPARKSLLLYDTCESGSLTGATRGSDIDERLGALNRMARATGRTFLTATTDDAPALEGFHGHGVFTYALLDAFDHADVNHDGLIEISELADYVDQKVPDYSFEAFKLRQIPQRSIVGNNFAVTNKAEVMAAAPVTVAAGDPSAPIKPTHVVVSANPANVFQNPNSTASVVQKLPTGTLVSVVRSADGWAFVATNGKTIGYVEYSQLTPIQ